MRRVISDSLWLLSLLPRRPLEFYDRLAARLEMRQERSAVKGPAYPVQEWETVIDDLETHLRIPLHNFRTESGLREIEEEVQHGLQQLPAHAPFSRKHSADFALAAMCYVACRALKPAVVIETGVAYAVNSAFMLKALEINGTGALYSIDLPPSPKPGADQFVGVLVPQSLRHRWHLYRGSSKRVMPGLLAELKSVDIFVHDSLHTYGNMRWEFEAVTPFLAPRAMVIADDIQGNCSFQEWATRMHPTFEAAVREPTKKELFGVSLLNDAIPDRQAT